ncbi:MAG: hypothetical protein ABIG44_06465 [Planctomycetota bacterium]
MKKSKTHPASGWWLDAAILLALASIWIGLVSAITQGRLTVMYDTFRDMAWAENIRAGRVWSDPTIAGHPYWYAPGNPLLFTAISHITGYSITELYGTSARWLNMLLPLLLYLLLRQTFDRTIALLALPVTFLGSFWWLTHTFAGMPSIQGVIFNLAALLSWRQCVLAPSGRRRAWLWPLLTGVLVAASIWHHPLCGGVLAGAIFLHAVYMICRGGVKPTLTAVSGNRWRVLLHMLVVAVIAAVLAGPLIWHLATLPKVNLAPLRFFAGELLNPDYYAHAHAPLVVPIAIIGAAWILWRRTRETWIVAYLLVGLVGQAAGYLGHEGGWSVPYLLPHEFQWHAHLATGICATVGIVVVARHAARLWTWPRRLELAIALRVILLLAVTVGPAMGWLSHAGVYLLNLEPLCRVKRAHIEWIRRETPLDAVFACTPEFGYQVVAGLTGRKCVCVPAGHMNPATDATSRMADLEVMLKTSDERTFLDLARQYQAIYLIPPEEKTTAISRYTGWQCLEPVLLAENDSVLIYRIRP